MAGLHTAIEGSQNPWLDWVEVNSLDSLAPGKELPLYFVHRVSSVWWHLSNYNCLSQIQTLVFRMCEGARCHCRYPLAFLYHLLHDAGQ